MGADNFMVTITAKTAEDGFLAAVDQAQWEYGHGGYTGTIAEKHGFTKISMPARMTVRKFEEVIMEYTDASWAVEDARSQFQFMAGQQRQGNPIPKAAMAKCLREMQKAEKKRDALEAKYRGIARVAELYNDKWGAALCVELSGTAAKVSKEIAGRKGTRDKVFTFFGLASS
jgi:hypothetical protein